jgi:hypothetical protein
MDLLTSSISHLFVELHFCIEDSTKPVASITLKKINTPYQRLGERIDLLDCLIHIRDPRQARKQAGVVLLIDEKIQSCSGQSYLLSFRPGYEFPSSHVSTAIGRATDGPEH